jgi:hypothetical protein
MKVIGHIIWILAVFLTINMIRVAVLGNYEYTRTIGSYWTLAEKASTIPVKSDYVDKFIVALEQSGLQGSYNAVWLKTPDNSFDKNLEMLKSLQKRLHEIKTIDIQSFQYQTAIQQITAQEQGEAKEMLDIFYWSWWKVHHFFLWDWMIAVSLVLITIMAILGIAVAVSDYDYR